MKDVPKAIEAVWKIESTRLIAGIARVTHEIGIADSGDALARHLFFSESRKIYAT
jgi:hypothetical protein